MVKVSPREQARSRLFEVFQKQAELLGHKPSAEEFFPVQLDKIMELLLPDWRLIQNRDLLHKDISNPILGKADFKQKIIFLDADAEPRVQRYTTAHELGHIFLEHGGCQLKKDTGPRSVLRPQQLEPPDPTEIRRERDANAFAAELLMPERTVLREFKKRFQVDRLGIRSSHAQTVLRVTFNRAEDAAKELVTAHYPTTTQSSLMDFFEVSATAMRVRLLELSLVY